MTDFPDVKLKALVQFPANVYGGTAINIVKANQNYTVHINYGEFLPATDIVPSNVVGLVWDPVNDVYYLAPLEFTGGTGIGEAPIDGAIYARKNAAWIMLYASGEAPPAPSGGFTTSLSGPGTLVVPSGKTTMIGEAWGGGGGGAGYGGTPVNQGAGGGGYSRFTVAVTPGQTIYFSVGAGGGSGFVDGSAGGTSWVNPTANVQPTSIGCKASGGGGGGNTGGNGGGGSGTVGTVNYNGGNGVTVPGGGGGGGAGSAGPGSNAVGAVGGAGGSPDGGNGGDGKASLPAANGSPGSPIGGGGGGGIGTVVTGGAGANGQIRLSFP